MIRARDGNLKRNIRIVRAVTERGLTFGQVAEEMGLTRDLVSGVCRRSGVSATWTKAKSADSSKRSRQRLETEWARPDKRAARVAAIRRGKARQLGKIDGELQHGHDGGTAGRGASSAHSDRG